jgi:hypothetical protein
MGEKHALCIGHLLKKLSADFDQPNQLGCDLILKKRLHKHLIGKILY